MTVNKKQMFNENFKHYFALTSSKYCVSQLNVLCSNMQLAWTSDECIEQ